MINYSLKCAKGHSFDSWFQSASAYDKLAAAGMVACSFCGSTEVEKAMMAPRVRPGRKAASKLGEPEQPQAVAPSPPAPATTPASAAPVPAQPGAAGPGALSVPSGELESAIRELREKVEKNSDYVGDNFVQEARAMHLGESPERAIYGEARMDQAKELIEEGIPVMPLPFGPNRKSN
ncbi:DUF1178 family protein [Roseobacter sp. SK209-2-6]|uniref:DUF1178 family protein n=1 Tax=Roseobacter sp. SK209-2-6 TaxID=388739 RepID=UPI00031989F1|nr:DUF1178 family protein [Roseobacter sp. SK209-2-6]